MAVEFCVRYSEQGDGSNNVSARISENSTQCQREERTYLNDCATSVAAAVAVLLSFGEFGGRPTRVWGLEGTASNAQICCCRYPDTERCALAWIVSVLHVCI